LLQGPFTHQINQGGLDFILATQILLSTTARGIAGGGDAVRANFYGPEESYPFLTEGPPTAHESIEFMSRIPIEKNTPGFARWYLPEGDSIAIVVTRVKYRDGSIKVFIPAESVVRAAGCVNWQRPWGR
jgi:hypothetical protein